MATAEPNQVCRGGPLDSPDNESGGQLHPLAGRSVPVIPDPGSQKQLDGCGTHVGYRLTNSGDRWIRPLRFGHVVESDDAEAGRDVDAEVAGRVIDPERDDVGTGEDRGRTLGGIAQHEVGLRARHRTIPVRVPDPHGVAAGAVELTAEPVDPRPTVQIPGCRR